MIRRFTPGEVAQYQQDHWREQGAIRFVHADDYDAAMSMVKDMNDGNVKDDARIRELEAALQNIAVGLLPEDKAAGNDKMYMLCASRLCGLARDAIRYESETKAEPVGYCMSSSLDHLGAHEKTLDCRGWRDNTPGKKHD